MEIRKITDFAPLFDYYQRIRTEIPYWQDTDYALWKESFCADTDYDADVMFRQLHTYTAEENGNILGFIQFGIPNFLYDASGEKNWDHRGGIIRNFYFEPDAASTGRELLALADTYFKENQVVQRFAFFHAFGMTCNAGHGKLYTKLSRVEQALLAQGFRKEHENVYYSRALTDADLACDEAVALRFGEMNTKGMCEFSILAQGEWVGTGAYAQLPQGQLAYLRWIFIDGPQQGKGYGAAALRALFAQLAAKGVERLDTDTADGNMIAQGLYLKTGFRDMGRTRSYLVPEE